MSYPPVLQASASVFKTILQSGEKITILFVTAEITYMIHSVCPTTALHYVILPPSSPVSTAVVSS